MRKRGKNREKRDGRKGGGVSASLPTLETEATQMEKKKRKEKQNQQGRKKRERETERYCWDCNFVFQRRKERELKCKSSPQ